MNIHCLMHHEWDGCKCRRCGHTRDEGHAWDGCLCRTCGQIRDEEHDFVTIHCQVVCQRCGNHSGWAHRWQECVCRDCGKERHVWIDGVCRVCGERCRHPQTDLNWNGPTDGDTSRGYGIVSCARCGHELRQVGREGERAPL